MYLNYSDLPFNTDGTPEIPELVLQTMDGTTIGIIQNAYNIKLNVKFSEPSELSFDVADSTDGVKNRLYEKLSGYKIIYTKHYGVYITMNPSEDSDGIAAIKHVTAYSIEKELDKKKFFIEEGTFKFYNQTDHTDENTIIGRILEVAPGWSVGYISPDVAQRYRTFEQYDNYLLSFIYGDATTKYRAVFVFDPYQKTINVYDADAARGSIPIYLDFENLLESININEVSDELVTALRPYGADELDIRDVNPIGSNWVYNIDYFIKNGDISDDIASKWNAWEASVAANRQKYSGLAALRASATSRLLVAQAGLVDLQGELDDLTNQQSVTIQAMALEDTDSGKAYQQELLDTINQNIAAKKAEIEAQEQTIASINEDLDESNSTSYTAQMKAIVSELAISNYFTDEEYGIITHYLIEQDLTESSFVASSVDTTLSGTTISASNIAVEIEDSAIVKIDLADTRGKRVYTLTGGSFLLSGDATLSGDIIRGTMEEHDDGQYVLSVYCGDVTIGEHSAESGVLTLSGIMKDFLSDIGEVIDDGISSYEGSTLEFISTSGSAYLTANVSDYQKYAVKLELYEYANDTLKDLATPTYEFSLDSGNFIFAKEFTPFRKNLELGKNLYLKLKNRVITPYIIELEVNFEDRSELSLIFSNRFKRHDGCNTLKDMIETSYSTSRSFDSSKYIYNKAAAQAPAVSDFMNGSLDAAKNTIVGASNQSVIINGAGINVGGNSKHQLRIVDNMIAMTDDNWSTAKLAIGLFASQGIGEYWGVNAEVIGGKLIVGNNLVIENTTDTGVMQFKVDSTGAWLNNSTMVFQKDDGGRMLADPKYGLIAGTSLLFDTDGTTVSPSFIDENGDIIFDDDGMPENANFFLDLRDGSAYFRGCVYATDGYFSGTLKGAEGDFAGKIVANEGEIAGWVIKDGILYSNGENESSSNFVGLSSKYDKSGSSSTYAIWAGSESATSAPFSVKRDGTVSMKNGLIECGVNVGDGKFVVDSDGNVTMGGGINMSGAITFNGTTYSDFQAAVRGTQTDSVGLTNLNRYKIYSTSVSGSRIESPTIEGNEIKVYGSFQTYDEDGSSISGYMGYAQGSMTDGNGGTLPTHGIAISTTNETITTSTEDPYVIVTTAGTRMSAGDNAFFVTTSGIFFQLGDEGISLRSLMNGTARFG